MNEIRIRTPHRGALVEALAARELPHTVLADDVVVVEGLAPDDLGWLAAAAGVVIYEMTPAEDVDRER